jgi:hypothetical protein
VFKNSTESGTFRIASYAVGVVAIAILDHTWLRQQRECAPIAAARSNFRFRVIQLFQTLSNTRSTTPAQNEIKGFCFLDGKVYDVCHQAKDAKSTVREAQGCHACSALGGHRHPAVDTTGRKSCSERRAP